MVQPQFDSQALGDEFSFDSEGSLCISDILKTNHLDDSSLYNLPTYQIEPSQSDQDQSGSDRQIVHWTGQTGNNKQWNIYLGDAKQVLSTLPDNMFQCAITSPPYYWLRDYGVDGQIGKEWKVSEYVQAIGDIMDQVKRVLASDGVLFLEYW